MKTREGIAVIDLAASVTTSNAMLTKRKETKRKTEMKKWNQDTKERMRRKVRKNEEEEAKGRNQPEQKR